MANCAATPIAGCHGWWLDNPRQVDATVQGAFLYHVLMLVLGIESSCDETGLALYDSELGLLTQALHSQVALHADYGGVVPELASRDHCLLYTSPSPRDAS